MTAAELKAELTALAEPTYRIFAASLIPGEKDLLGVRLPQLRRLARQAARQNAQELFSTLRDEHGMEIIMLRGMLPGYARKATLNDRLTALKDFVPSIRNWSICDSCCATYLFMREHRQEVLTFLRDYLSSDKEFHARFAVVCLLNHFVCDEEWAGEVAQQLLRVQAEGYYARMAVAWCACELLLRYPNTYPDLLSRLPEDIQRLTLRKIRESRRKPKPHN